MKYVASCSFGKDSLAMLLRLIEEKYPLDSVVFYDTGVEFNAIYENMKKVEWLLQERGVEFVILQPTRSFLYDMMEKPIKARNNIKKIGRGWCGGLCRWGTAEKRAAINRYYKTFGTEAVVEYVGLAADELGRINRDRQRNSVKLYPLIEWGMTEADCLEYCYSKGWNWKEEGVELYSILDRVSCWCCKNKNLRELENIYLYLPTYWSRLKELQTQIPAPFKGEGKSIFDLEKKFVEKYKK